MGYTHQQAIDLWLQGVTNASLSFRPVIYRTNAIPKRSDILSALQALSRLTRYGGFIDENIEELYAQQVQYAIEHMSLRVWGDAQCIAARDAITDTLSSYLHYDPAIGNDISYQTKCFHKTLRLVDKAYDDNKGVTALHGFPIEVWEKVIPCCLTPYYKHTMIKDPDAQPGFKYVPHDKRKTPPNDGFIQLTAPETESLSDILIIDEEDEQLQAVLDFLKESDET